MESKAVVKRDPAEANPLVPTSQEVLTQATELAGILTKMVEKQKLYANIQGRRHVLYEGWTTLGALCGQVLGDAVFPITVWSRPIEGGFEARVEARTYSGALVGAAEAQCTKAEATWKGRDDYALRSMAQTRAGSKALRMPLGWIMQLAGFDATPAEEIPREDGATPAARRRPRPRAELEAEAREMQDPKPWACSHCETGEKIPGTMDNCPKCGHLRGAKADVPAGEAAVDAEEGITAGADGPVDITPGAVEAAAGHASPGADPEKAE